MEYIILLALTWLFNGSAKYAVNMCFHGRKNALGLVGYGGFPSTHTAIVSAQLFYVGMQHGFNHPAVAAILALLWVVVNDATSLRKKIQDHAQHLNKLDDSRNHRERIAHHWRDIVGGFAMGAITALIYAEIIKKSLLTF